MYYVTMEITFLTRKFRNGERILHCDVVHITTKWVSSLTLDCNGVFAIKAYNGQTAGPIRTGGTPTESSAFIPLAEVWDDSFQMRGVRLLRNS